VKKREMRSEVRMFLKKMSSQIVGGCKIIFMGDGTGA